MAISNGSGLTSITGSVSVNNATAFPSASSSQTLVSNVYAVSSPGNSEDVYTVPAGKTFYLMGFAFTNAGAATGVVYIFTNAGGIYFYGTSAVGSFSGVSGSIPIYSVAATEKLKVRMDNANMRFNYWGYIQ